MSRQLRRYNVRRETSVKRRWNWFVMTVAGELVLAFVLGGSGSRNDVALMVIELGSLPLLATGFWRIASARLPRSTVYPLALLVAVCCLPLMQLLPLPAAIWNNLPGRSAAIQSLALSGEDQGWRPLSLMPDATWRSFLWLLPPASLFLGTIQLEKAGRLGLAITILGLVSLSLLIAGLQIVGVSNLHFDSLGNNDLPTGLFANRNHQADAMVIGLPLSAAVAVIWSRSASVGQSVARYVLVGIVGLLSTGALVTLSRAGLVLGGLGLLGAFVIFVRSQTSMSAERRVRNLVLFMVAIVVIIVSQVGIGPVMSRFDRANETETRLRFWPTIVETASDYFPAGAGLGTFDPVYRSVEPPETVGHFFVNAAHNDYLQIWLEGGILGLALLAAFLAWMANAASRVLRAPPQMGVVLAQGACMAIAIMLLHSLVDYPLRTPALASVFAVLCGFVVGASGDLANSRQLQYQSTV